MMSEPYAACEVTLTIAAPRRGTLRLQSDHQERFMDNDDVKTARQYADEARQSAREAADAARNFAQASVDAADSIRHGASVGAQDALAGARSYAREAVNASGRRITAERDRLEAVRRLGERYVTDQPMRAALVAAAGGALLTALFVALLNNPRR